MIIEQIDKDLKQAMLQRDKELVEVLRGLKSAILYEKVAPGADKNLSEQTIMTVLKKEQKKRADAIVLYKQANDLDRSNKELSEWKIIAKYLPDALDESAVSALIDNAVNELGGLSQQNMGQVISAVKQASGGAADGALVAKLVKGKLN